MRVQIVTNNATQRNTTQRSQPKIAAPTLIGCSAILWRGGLQPFHFLLTCSFPLLLFNLIFASKWLLFFKLSISILFKWTGLIINVNTYNCLLFSLNNSYYFKSAYFMFFSFSFSIYYVVLFFLAFKIIFSKLNELVLFTL